MLRRSAPVLVLLAACSTASAGDREALVGTWRIDVFQDDGRDRLDRLAAGPPRKPGQPARVAYLVFTKDECRVVRGDGKRQTIAGLGNAAWKSVVLDESTEPKSIDVVGFAGKDGSRTKTYLGIYALEGDTLTICWCEQGNERPAKLESNGANNLFRCTRVAGEPRP